MAADLTLFASTFEETEKGRLFLFLCDDFGRRLSIARLELLLDELHSDVLLWLPVYAAANSTIQARTLILERFTAFNLILELDGLGEHTIAEVRIVGELELKRITHRRLVLVNPNAYVLQIG